MFQSKTSLEQVGPNIEGSNFEKLGSNLLPPSIMSAECGSAVPQSLAPQALSHSTPLNSNGIRSERLSHPGISYEGRVSLISPHTGYDASLRAAFGLEHHSQHLPRSHLLNPHLHSPPFSLSHHNQMPPEHQSMEFSEESRRVLFAPHPQHHNALPGSSRDFDLLGQQYNIENFNPLRFPIKQEIPDKIPQETRSGSPKEDLEGTLYDQETVLRFAGSRSAEDDGASKEEKSPEKKNRDPSHTKDYSCTQPRSSHDDLGNGEFLMNDENEMEQSSPYRYQDNDDNPPSSLDSGPEDSRDGENDPMTLIDNSFEGSLELFEHGENSKAIKCQFCSYSTDSQFHFNSHFNTHFDHKCMKCEFTTHTVTQLKEHLQEEHGLTAEDAEDQHGIRVPRVNSQGKVKTYKCKQCGYVAITKSDFWKHAKSHIKSEKLLMCTKCPFVTEYKHHLEYHMRNHLGCKPYKCSKCPYSCVNKSMLNSHMKSHSNIYQYRCSDCTYATKYCHSLKLHLRKYCHSPAMVLNPDGTPNPVPIIDIYGTRRGPKLKKDENGMPILPPQYQLQAHFVRAHMEVTGNIPPAPTVPPEKPGSNKNGGRSLTLSIPHPPFPNPFSLQGNFQNYSSFIPQEFKETNERISQANQSTDQFNELTNEQQENMNASKSPEVEDLLKCALCNFSTPSKDILSHHQMLHSTQEKQKSEKLNDSPTYVDKKMANEYSTPKVTKSISSPTYSHMNGSQQGPSPQVAVQSFHEYFARAMNPLIYQQMLSGQNFVHPALELQQQLQRLVYQKAQDHSDMLAKEKFIISPSPIKAKTAQIETVLDLSKEQTPPNVVSSSQQHTISPSVFPTSPPTSDISTPPAKNRRKGRAYKLERIALRLSGSGEEGESSSQEGEEIQKEQEHKRPKISEVPSLLPLEGKEVHSSTVDSKWGEAHQCQYCDIAFKDVVMYTMHMGYHGYKDPFTCNMCGFDASDKLAFFLHIGRSSHL